MSAERLVALRARFALQLAAVAQSGRAFAEAAMQSLARFIKRGWRVVTEVHTIAWLTADVVGVIIPPIIFMIWADSYGLRTPFVTVAALILFGILSLAFLACLGYRDENPTGEAMSSQQGCGSSASAPTPVPSEPLSLPNTRFARIDGATHQGSGVQ